MSKQRGKLVLSSVEKEQLRELIRAQNTPQGLAQRARVVELAAQGMGVRAIGEQVGMHFNQVAKWRRDLPLDGSRVRGLQGYRAAGLE